MNDKPRIKFTEPLGFQKERIYGPYKICDYIHPRSSRILLHSDSTLVVSMKWCILEDNMNSGACDDFRMPANMYLSRQLKPLCPYFYIVVSRPDGTGSDSCDSMHIEIWNAEKLDESKDRIQPVALTKPRGISFGDSSPSSFDELLDREGSRKSSLSSESVIVSEVKEVTRSKSPFRPKIFAKSQKKTISSGSQVGNQIHGVDYRLPQFIPKGSILIGGDNGRIEYLPKPSHADMVLKSDEMGNFHWEFPYPPGLSK